MYYGTQDRAFFPADFTEKFRFLKELGFKAFEIDGKALVEHVDEVKKAVEETGLPVTTACGGYRGWIGDFDEKKRQDGIEDLKEILRCIKEVGGTGVVVPAAWGMFTFRLPPMVPPRSHEEDVKVILDSLGKLDPVAREYGVYIYLEPLNYYQDHMINTLADAAAIIDAGKFTNVKITADFYHMNTMEDDISKALVEFKDYIGHIHVAENHRLQPGTGSIDFKRHLKTLEDIGYTGPVINEGRLRGDELQAVKEGIAYMNQFI
ncbi:MAG: sugar phosphate isomerase/epimerase family protein [Eubacteriales bacterium]|nr:sugar phosphate isomerase/epimerase family protein [Eubacteriales bacterium]